MRAILCGGVMTNDAPTYVVKRHGGNVNHDWRIVGRWHDLDTARGFFRAEARMLRQGKVVLVNEQTNAVLDIEWGSRNRTRW